MTIISSEEPTIEEVAEEITDISDNNLDQTLRPQHFAEYIGQEKIKKNLDILLQGRFK